MTLEKLEQVLIDLKVVMEKSGRAEYEFQLVEIFHQARQAKQVLNTFIERLESEELVEKVAKAIAENERGNASEPFNEAMPDFTWGDYYKSSAKAAIKSIKDMI